mmetsp:Transcript_30898/g.91756  ORF Transcript_30898/g.91756 Transcript_30898/m.91756 type:complete len:282 (-) Transcript_30898:1186-2031(-)
MLGAPGGRAPAHSRSLRAQSPCPVPRRGGGLHRDFYGRLRHAGRLDPLRAAAGQELPDVELGGPRGHAPAEKADLLRRPSAHLALRQAADGHGGLPRDFSVLHRPGHCGLRHRQHPGPRGRNPAADARPAAPQAGPRAQGHPDVRGGAEDERPANCYPHVLQQHHRGAVRHAHVLRGGDHLLRAREVDHADRDDAGRRHERHEDPSAPYGRSRAPELLRHRADLAVHVHPALPLVGLRDDDNCRLRRLHASDQRGQDDRHRVLLHRCRLPGPADQRPWPKL